MCVALDYAKAQHTALICNGLGELLKSAFAVDNTPRGREAVAGAGSQPWLNTEEDSP